MPRDTPPDIQQGPSGYEPALSSSFDALEHSDSNTLDPVLAVKLGRETWDASTNWLNASRRARWNDSLRAFQNMHASGSKYMSNDYRYRSTLYRPKTRIMIRRDEAATAAAFFANEDVVSISAGNDDDPRQQASAEVLKALLQYRLANAEGDNKIPWFLTLIGARQDCGVMGIAVSKTGWTYQERFLKTEMRPVTGPDGMPQWNEQLQAVDTESVDLFEKVKDHPYINLIAPENFRFEPGCDWRDVVGTSPYLIEMSPVYIAEALERMESQRGAPAEWLRVPASALRGASDLEDDVTRRSREQGRVPGQDSDAWKPRDFDIAWTRINTVRWRGQDWYYRTLASSGELLEAPRPLSEVYLHGERPYVVGCCNIEAHRTYPASKVELVSDLQRAANQDWNSRFDTIMLSLQPRQFVREGSGNDANDLRTFMPGKVVYINGGKGEPLSNQVQWDRPPPVDGAAFQEQDRINLDFDDLTGAFTNSSQASSQITQQSATGMHLMSGEASGMNEYELRIFAETFVEPTLRLLIKTEQAYETDEIVLALAGKQAQLFHRYGINQVDNDLLQSGVTVRCNVGIGATNPQMKLRNFATGAQILGSMFGQSAAAGANFQEVSKELFGLLGYKDGARFFQPGFDPRVAMMQQQLGKQKQPDQSRLQATQLQAQSRLQERQLQQQTDLGVAQMDFKTKSMAETANTDRMKMKLAAEQLKMSNTLAHQHGMAASGYAHDRLMADQSFQREAPNAFADGGMVSSQPQAQAPPQELPEASPDQMYDMSAPEPQQSLQGSQPPHLVVSTARSPEEQESNRAMLQFLQVSMQNTQSTAQVVTEAVGQLAQAVQAGNAQLARALAQSTQQGEVQTDRIGQALQALAHVAQRNTVMSDAILTAMNRPKRVVRSPDGKIEGVE